MSKASECDVTMMTRREKFISILAFAGAVLTAYLSSNLCVLPTPMLWRQVFFVLAAGFMVLCGGGISKAVLLLFAFCYLSILVNNIPEFFQVEQRLQYFIVMITAIGPLLNGKSAQRFHYLYWKNLLYAFTVAAILSFFVYLLAWPQAFKTPGLLNGVLTHSMNLGPTAGVATVFVTSKIYARIVGGKRFSWLMTAIALICFAACALSGSRIAIISCLTGLAFTTYAVPSFRKIKAVSILVFVLLAIGYMTSATGWNEKIFNAVMEKQKYSLEHYDSAFGTRRAFFELRFEEFKEHPLCGLGFCSVSLKNLDSFDAVSGVIEPGNSWLFAFSSTGLLGGTILLYLYLVPIIKLFKRACGGDDLVRLLLAVLIFYAVHMMAEGYLLSAGNLSFALVWSSIAVAWSCCCDNGADGSANLEPRKPQ